MLHIVACKYELSDKNVARIFTADLFMNVKWMMNRCGLSVNF